MWYITHATSGQTFCFLPKKLKFTVGRCGTDLELQNDNCVSRAHSVFHLVKNNDQLQLEVEDSGSKFGTFCNNDIEKNAPLQKGQKIVLKDNDLIRFGRLQNLWRVNWMNLITVTSSLSEEDAENVNSNIQELGGKILDQWSSSCSHLTMKDPSITMKFLHALVDQKFIVTPEYWKDLLDAVRNKKSEFPKPMLYSPRFGDDTNVSCKPERRSLFQGLTFVFLNRKHFDLYSPIIKAAGGACKDLNSGVQKTFLIKAKVIVVQYTPSTQTQSSQTISTIAEFLESQSKRIIPEYEIGLAILHCSIEKFCNPCFKMTQTMPLAVSNEFGDVSMNVDLTDEQESSPSIDSQSLDLEIPETNENLVTSTPYDDTPNKLDTNNTKEDESMPSMCITETLVDNPRKRKVISANLEENGDDGLFKFPSKKSLLSNDKTSKDNMQEDDKPTTSNFNIFLEKSQTKNKNNSQLNLNETAEQSSDNKENRKRPHIQVLDENDENDDDLFSFGDTQKNKKNRTDQEKPNEDDDGLFDFKDKETTKTNDVDEDSNDLISTQQFIVTERPTKSKSSIYANKPKILPRKISAIDWISGSLGKIKIKNENSTEVKDEETEVKPESDIKEPIKEDPEDDNITEDHRKWLDSLKDAIEIQQIALNNGIKYSDKKSHYILKNRSNNSSLENLNETSGKNFKTFIKKYYLSTEQNNSANIQLHVR